MELTTLEKLLKETSEWLASAEKEQAALKPHEPVKLTLQAIAEKIATVNREIGYLMHKVKIWKPPKPKEEAPKNDTAKAPEKEEVIPPEEKPEEAPKTEEAKPETPLGDAPEITPTKPG